MSYPFKICDSVHGFIRFGEIERQVIDSYPFQRLRYIHQMGAAYLIYPGATHTRFEHSLGVMELVTRIYNTLIEPHHQLVPIQKSKEEIDYWRLILRLAALCHDMGHLPFSHTAEKSLLPNGGHEQMTIKIIESSELQDVWRQIGPQAAHDITKLAVDGGFSLSPWERVLSQLITEDNFGADRIDYLIRDGHYTGVGYGHFDYHQLIDCLRILPFELTVPQPCKMITAEAPQGRVLPNEWSLGVTASGVQSVESLWIARYMMYARVYHHPKTRIYNYHLHRFMRKCFPQGLSVSVAEYLEHTDYTLLTTLADAARKGDYDALCLLKRVPPYSEVPLKTTSPELIRLLEEKFSSDLYIDETPPKEMCRTFPVYEGGEVTTSYDASPFLRAIPPGGKPVCLFIHPKKEGQIQEFIRPLA